MIELHGQKLKLDYEIIGNLSQYNFPKPTKQQRANELWRDTCFELFIANTSQESYHEMNISPSIQWNCYHFNAYKEDMKESTLILAPTIKTTQNDQSYKLSVETTIQEEFFHEILEINLAVILLDTDNTRHFYTLKKRDGVPDFHDREGFLNISQ